MYIVPVFVPHAGCMHECTFCNQRLISGQQQFNIAAVQGQLLDFIERLPLDTPKQVALYGGSFTAIARDKQQAILEYVQSVAPKYNITSLRVSTRPDCIDLEKLELLSRYNVQVVELGVQSLSDTVLNLVKRGHTASIVPEAVQLLRQQGFKVGIQLMVGMPGQDFAVVRDTAQTVATWRPDMVRIYSLMVLRGTQLEAEYLAGAFQPLSLDESIEQAAYIWEAMRAHKIPVIRMGLQAEELLAENIIAGAYHPAFGELVIQRYYLRLLLEQVTALQAQGGVEICINYPQRMASKIIGMKKYNKLYLKERFPALKLFWQVTENVPELLVQIKPL